MSARGLRNLPAPGEDVAVPAPAGAWGDFADSVDHAGLIRDLASARRIQQMLLPRAWPNLGGLDLAGDCASAHAVGGDFYDVISLPSQASVLLVVADVMGKSVPAALFSATLRALIRTVTPGCADPGVILRRLNELLIDDLSAADMFITVQLCLADMSNRELLVASAGHCPLLVRSRSGSVHFLADSGLPLGVASEADYASHRLELASCRNAVFYTDGIIEAQDPTARMLGCEGLERIVQQCPEPASAAALKECILSGVAAFQGAGPSKDDQTLLVAAWT